MYTDDDLTWAIKEDIFNESSVALFQQKIADRQPNKTADEENIKFISSFNDIFVVIASILVLLSALWLLKGSNAVMGYVVFALLSWAIAEVFVYRKHMALPALVLFFTYAIGCFQATVSTFGSETEVTYLVASLITLAAAYVHWLRFKVPVTVAVAAAFFALALFALASFWFDSGSQFILVLISIIGVSCFIGAMYWDMSDLKRLSYRSDVAFWLHLLAAPLIIHPIFTLLGIFKGEESAAIMVVVLLLYAFMTLLSIIIDRRAFMVSALIYVLYALSSLLENTQFSHSSTAITGVIIGGSLLLLSALWGKSRNAVVKLLPYKIQQHIPTSY